MATRTSLAVCGAFAICLMAAVMASVALADQPPPPPGEAWKSSPHHGVIDGATGKPIPCICRFKGRDFRLGASVCMETHVGVVIARCDMILNNTTWAPTSEPCAISWRQPSETLPRG